MRISWQKQTVLGAVVVLAAAGWWTSPAVAADFRTGDQFIVARQNAPLKRGSETLATLPQGQRLKVLETDGDWVGTSVMLNGRAVTGWVHRPQVATPTEYAAQRATRRFSYQPPAPSAGTYSPPSRSTGRSSSNGQFIMGLTPYGRSYWRADRKISGY